MRRGDVYLCDFGDPIGHEQGYRRPAVIVSADAFSATGLAIVLPVTRSRRGYATHVELEGTLPVTSYVQCEQIRLVSTERFVKHVAVVDEVDMMRIQKVLRLLLEL
ncbi:type II toxin-antitoxin system PemK/MazF family toxin [Jiangella rhizosphaerae]|uniref:mRNA interferase n=1 Tax=Jiangella rhizosphaerae TaxID=2293569 RepID=A0A418KQ39_9ACTN|nr:type II toxin-antitoxin system PemK/MazF family toxin [Jiangella rhizosphaerae]RIQ22268.1 type II toxin-antitoxin system PemK/MazF family toxin [Jiangella rhizosphaerae]